MPSITAHEIEAGATAYRRLIQLVGLQVLVAVTAALYRSALVGEPGPALALAVVSLTLGLVFLLAGAVTAYTLAKSVDAGPAWLWALALLLPGLSLLVLLYLHLRAGAWCRRRRIETGLLGPTAAAVARLRLAARAKPRTVADRLVGGAAIALLAALALAAPAHLYVKPRVEQRRATEELRREYTRLTALPPETARAFFDATHAECRRRAGAVEGDAHTCLDAAFAERLGRVLTLESPQWEPHPDPGWAKLGFTVRVVDGALPEQPTAITDYDCGDGRPFRIERPIDSARASVLVPRRPGPCVLKVSLKEGRWSLGSGLAVETPAPTPVPLDLTGLPSVVGVSDAAAPAAGASAQGQGLPPALVDPLLRNTEVSLLSWHWRTAGEELAVRVRTPGLVSLADYVSTVQRLPECKFAEITTPLPEGERNFEAEIVIGLKAE
jgi:hypothetical protein